ncbi:HEPN domain-containing protein [Terriglobus sp. RCC_193]|uniref:HEPN domain-containing protein n=1 Tax=Terriglobus sp. RCC_193 TaxID=3239218 RepID=UPI003523E38E
MTRSDFQLLAELRLQEAQLLLSVGSYSGAYYLAGYVVECALKACIAKSTQAYDFPDRKRTNDSYSHDVASLLKTAGLESALKYARQDKPGLGTRWEIAREWNEGSRYRIWQKADAAFLLEAVDNSQEGVLAWLKQHW